MGQAQRESVARLSRVMATLSAAGFVIFPAVVTYTFLEPDSSQWMMFHYGHLGAELTSSIPLEFRLLALVCALAPTAFTMWALWSLRRLFLLYARGSVFSAEALTALNSVAVALFASVVVAFAMQAPISLTLTWPRGWHHREISLGFGSNDVFTLFMAGVVLVIARVMAEAQRMADENAKFV
ncbi:MAG TPA: DUF2975 domain-containing protein [Rhizomicrobium sp.]|nr:DUF2975 domain-containing protein [Rhizomicrobium sp.]